MMCFKHLVPYALLLPMSSASPIFIFLFSIMLFFTVRPCGYCLALISVLFLSTSPSSPFNSLQPPPLVSDDIPRLTDGLRSTWLDLNSGQLFDPVIRAFSSPTITSPPSSTVPAREGLGMPDGYVDLRYRGLGFVWDFGWKRSEEGMEWELRDWEETKGRYALDDLDEGKEVVGKNGGRRWSDWFRLGKGGLLGDW